MSETNHENCLKLMFPSFTVAIFAIFVMDLWIKIAIVKVVTICVTNTVTSVYQQSYVYVMYNTNSNTNQ